MTNVPVQSFDVPALPDVDRAEVLRYLGTRVPSREVDALLDDCLAESADCFAFRLCFARFPAHVSDGTADLSFAAVHSEHLARHLASCQSVVLFAATVGIGIDRLIRRYAAVSPARSLCLQAIGNERIEALCDAFEEDVRTHEAAAGGSVCPRFSPGYGDLPLSLQADIFRVLDCPRRMGLTLNNSLLMTPEKSVTAIIGISEG